LREKKAMANGSAGLISEIGWIRPPCLGDSEVFDETLFDNRNPEYRPSDALRLIGPQLATLEREYA
jgi:hypothetical protein